MSSPNNYIGKTGELDERLDRAPSLIEKYMLIWAHYRDVIKPSVENQASNILSFAIAKRVDTIRHRSEDSATYLPLDLDIVLRTGDMFVRTTATHAVGISSEELAVTRALLEVTLRGQSLGYDYYMGECGGPRTWLKDTVDAYLSAYPVVRVRVVQKRQRDTEQPVDHELFVGDSVPPEFLIDPFVISDTMISKARDAVRRAEESVRALPQIIGACEDATLMQRQEHI